MNFKAFLRKPMAAVTGLSVFVGLLVDFQGAASKLGGVLGVMEGFLPMVAIGGSVFFGGWTMATVLPFSWSLRPSARFGKHFRSIVKCRDNAMRCMQSNMSSNALFAQLTQLSNTLGRFGITCPKVSPQSADYELGWFNFLTNLAPLALHKDLRAARRLHQAMSEAEGLKQ